ncbi:MAG: twin-arginine translocase TatA/TatE family subunit [Bacteriovoracaceae bacterium]|nr:twin-arginine translocase TatA/TatE family subunit [Bacteriovoracaceae bacterium]
MFGLGTGEIFLIVVAIFVLFGVKRIPELGHSIGKGIKNFKKGLNDRSSD